MACSTKKLLSILSLLLFVMVLLINTAQVTLAGRPTPATAGGKTKQTQYSDNGHAAAETSNSKIPSGKAGSNPDVKQTDCLLGHEGTVLIPGVGRYMVGSQPQLPTVGRTFLGDSVPAAANGQYLPGNDDTFVPNPGYEVPNPFRGASVSSTP